MALINTTERGKYMSTKAELARSVRLAMAEELSATNTYEDLIESVRSMIFREVDQSGVPVPIPEGYFGKEEAEKIIKRLEELRDDEIHHTGALIALVEDLDQNSALRLSEGATGA